VVPESFVLNGERDSFHLLVGHIQELLGVIRSGTIGNDIEGSEACLPSRSHKDEDWVFRRVLHDGRVSGLVHGGHTGTVVLSREASNMNLHGHRPDGRTKVKETLTGLRIYAEPISEVMSIGESSG